jgi:hypothetical protein
MKSAPVHAGALFCFQFLVFIFRRGFKAPLVNGLVG